MVLISRDNWGGTCTILERNLEFKNIGAYLRKIEERLLKEGWHVDRESPLSILAYRGPFESISYLPYYKRVPSKVNQFVWY